MSERCISNDLSGGTSVLLSYWDFLLRQYNSAILSSYANRHDIRGSDGFESIF